MRVLYIGSLVAVTMFGALFAADAKIEAAKEKFEKTLNKLNNDYNDDLDKAKSSISKVYEKQIKALRKKGKDAEAEAMGVELEEYFAKFSAEKNVKPSAHTALIESIGEGLQNSQEQAIPAAKVLGNKPVVFLYFSAHWCGPCRSFTPKLVDFYNKHGGGQNFEIVFVSSDRDKNSMFSYMKEAKMPWLTVPYHRIDASTLKSSYGGRGIPNLVLLDAKGQVLAGSYEGDNYVGPNSVIDFYKKNM